MEVHQQISASDKDFPPTFAKMCLLVTKDVHQVGVLTGEFSAIYDDDTLNKLGEQDGLEAVAEDQWLEDVYGAHSRLENTEWVQRVVKEGKWIFNAKDLRKRVFEQQEVDYKE